MTMLNDLSTPYITEHDYLAGEKIAEVRHEYCDGQVYAMAGSSKRHNTLALNLVIALRTAAKDLPCAVYASDIKVKVNARKSYYYPDVVVSCDEQDHADDYYLEKPCFIVEVLSPSTARKDSTEKLLAYQDIESLQVYMMVDQDRYWVSLFYKQEDDRWWVKHYTQDDDIIAIPCPAMALSVADIYASLAMETKGLKT